MFNRFAVLRERVIGDEMTRHGLMLVAFNVTGNIFIYLYQLIMGIMLEPEQYGLLFGLTSMFSIVMVIAPAISATLARFTSKLVADDKLDGLPYLWKLSLKRTGLVGLGISIFFFGLSPFIARFFHMGNPLHIVILFSAIIFLPLFSTNTGILQGLQRFVPLGITYVLQSGLALATGTLFVYIGLGVSGGLLAFPLSYGVALLVTFFLLRALPKLGNERINVTGISAFSRHVLLAIFIITTLTNLDVILAKHYFSATQAGSYSIIALMGRVALYLPTGIIIAMFPKTSRIFESGGDHQKVFWRALLLTFLLSSSVVLIYIFFSQSIVQLLFHNKYPLIVPYIPRYAAAMILFALSAITMNFLLSIGKTKVVYSLLGVVLVQVLLILVYHTDFVQLINIMIICGALCMASMLPFILTIIKRGDT